MTCHYCKSTARETRPYGPNGAHVCHPCGTSPEHVADTEAAFKALLDGAERASPRGVAMIGLDAGPLPMPKENDA